MRVRYFFSSRKTRTLARDNKHRKEFPDIDRQVISHSEIVLEILDSGFGRKQEILS